jgi:hypothetical protein
VIRLSAVAYGKPFATPNLSEADEKNAAAASAKHICSATDATGVR